MKNFSHKKVWVIYTNLSCVEPPTILLIKETSTCKSDAEYVKLKLRRDPTSSTSDFYEFKMCLFDHLGPGKSLLSVQNFQMTIADVGTLEKEAKVQYFCTLVHGGALR